MSSLFRSGSLSLHRPESATLLAATRGRRRLFLVLPLFLVWLVRQKAGERLCTWDESHRQGTPCEEEERERSVTRFVMVSVIKLVFYQRKSLSNMMKLLLSNHPWRHLHMQKKTAPTVFLKPHMEVVLTQ